MKQPYFCSTLLVERYNSKCDSEFARNRAQYMPNLVGKVVVIVDFSDAHGLCYGVVRPNYDGDQERQDTLPIYWLDPSEVRLLSKG